MSPSQVDVFAPSLAFLAGKIQPFIRRSVGTASTIVADVVVDAAVDDEGPNNDEVVDRAGDPLVVMFVVGADAIVCAATLATALALGFLRY